MKSMRADEIGELTWSQPKMTKREYELRSSAELCATLKWQRPLGSLATGESADGIWTFKRLGFLRPRVNIRAEGSIESYALYEAGWAGGGRLLFPDAHGYFWRQRSFWHNEWAFESERGDVVCQFRAGISVFRQKTQLSIIGRKNNIPDLSLLAILGLYLMILSNDDAAVVVS
jgi:hypothetical protein